MKTTRKTRFIENLYTLSTGEKKEITDFFTKYPNYESHIDWNSTSLVYQDFEKVFTLAENSLRNIKRKTKADPRLLFEKYNCEIIGQADDFLIVVPLDWKCAVFFNSFDCGGEGAHWCIGNSNDAERWNSYRADKNVFFLMFFINKHPVYKRKVIIQYHVKDDKYTLWLQDNTESNQIPSPLDTAMKLIKNSAEQLLPRISAQSYILDDSTLTKGYDHERIDIPVGVTAIGENAFLECLSLKTITLPAGLVTIGDGTFCGCENLTVIDIPDSVTAIGDGAFCRCKNLTRITVEEKNQSFIDVDGVLFDKTKKRILCHPAERKDIHYMIPNGITVIEKFAFFGCENLEIINISKSVTTVVESFLNCKNISSIIVEKCNLFFIDVDGVLFDKEKNLILRYPAGKEDAHYAIPDGITAVDSWAFEGCKNLVAVDIPNSVTFIGEAFFGCENLTAITLPASLVAIWNYTFAGCKSLVTIDIPTDVTVIGDSAFRDCKSLKAINIPASVTAIGYGAFLNCESLATVNIPGNVTAIGNDAFHGCKSLVSINMPVGITTIGDCVFEGCKSLTTIDIPESVITIDPCAFFGCKSLTTIDIPESVITIDSCAFFGCKSLKVINIPAGVTTIGQSAFLGCENLEAVYLHRKTSILKNAFGNTQAKIFYKD
jgi:hypothetical protein